MKCTNFSPDISWTVSTKELIFTSSDYKTECDKNISHILNCHLYGASELWQLVIVAPSYHFFRYDQLHSWPGPVHTVCCWSIFHKWWNCNFYTKHFLLILCYIRLMQFQIFQPIAVYIFYPEHQHPNVTWNEHKKLSV